MAPTLPAAGAVLGVDIGFSPKRRSSAVCRLDWSHDTVAWAIERFRAVEPERSGTIRRIADRPMLAAAFDGPIRRGLDVIGRYRETERVLTRCVGRRIGKPGQSNVPVGIQLNAATNDCARIVRDTGHVAPARHAEAIDAYAIVETFPHAWLGLQIEAPELLICKRGNRSDVYYKHLADSGRLDSMLTGLLPGRSTTSSFAAVTNHDERAALVSALAALCLAAGEFQSVGDETDGWIILPSRGLWAGWALEALR